MRVAQCILFSLALLAAGAARAEDSVPPGVVGESQVDVGATGEVRVRLWGCMEGLKVT